MNALTSIFSVRSLAAGMLLAFAAVLLLILIISFRSRAVVFCQYLQTMTGIKLKPYQVAKVFRERGPDGVREFFLDLIIKEDLKQGPLVIPSDEASGH
jgi:Na+/H+ antiporter NhaA